MITAGCDVGSRTAKAVILDGSTIIASAVIPARLDPVESAEKVMAVMHKNTIRGFRVNMEPAKARR